MLVERIPVDILWSLSVLFPIEKGKCFSNSGIATVLSRGSYEYSKKIENNHLLIRYVLGFLIPPDQDAVPHAWLACTKSNKVTFIWDATLQVNSPLWNKKNQEFRYETKHVLTIDELRDWLQENYQGRDFTSDGIPHGSSRFPIINKAGFIE